MKALQTYKICIIDDELTEFLPLIYALSKLRLSYIHIAGDRMEDLPGKLSGLRLVFLDMHLGTAGDEAQITAHTANVFGNVVSATDGPVLVVVWTKHADYIQAFRERLYQAFPEFKTKLLFTRMDKPAALSVDPNITWPEIAARYRDLVPDLHEKIGAAIKFFYPLELLWRWEQLVHDAATATTSAVAEQASARCKSEECDEETREAEALLRGLSEIMCVLAQAEGEQNLTGNTAFLDLVAVLNTLHRDRLEHQAGADDEKLGDRLLAHAAAEPSATEKIKINSMLYIAKCRHEDRRIEPGALLRITDGPGFSAEFGCALEPLFSDCLNVPQKGVNRVLSELRSKKIDEKRRTEWEDKLKEEQQKCAHTRAEWFLQCVPVLLDVSPSCDYSQRTVHLSRLMAGVLIPSRAGIEHKARSDESAFRSLPDIIVPGLDGVWTPVFCSRLILSHNPDADLRSATAVCRLREPLLSDLRNWAASHSARIGYVKL